MQRLSAVKRPRVSERAARASVGGGGVAVSAILACALSLSLHGCLLSYSSSREGDEPELTASVAAVKVCSGSSAQLVELTLGGAALSEVSVQLVGQGDLAQDVAVSGGGVQLPSGLLAGSYDLVVTRLLDGAEVAESALLLAVLKCPLQSTQQNGNFSRVVCVDFFVENNVECSYYEARSSANCSSFWAQGRDVESTDSAAC